MKKTYRLWIIIPLLALFVYSCKKDQEPMTNPVNQAQLEKSQQIIQRIEAFDAKLTGNFKSGESMSVDSLVWYTEALENYNHARPDLAYENFVVSKTTYTATLDNGNLSMEEAAALYSTMQTDLETELANLDPTDDKLKLTDIALDSIEGNTAYLSAKRVFGLRLVSGIYEPFDADDDWYWGYDQGKCDGTMAGVSDASNEIQRRMNNPWVVPLENYRFILNTLETTEVDVFFNREFEFRLFGGFGYGYYFCVSDEYLTYYLEQSHLIFTDPAEGIVPNNKQLYHISIDDRSYLNGSYTSHGYFATYGEVTLIPPID